MIVGRAGHLIAAATPEDLHERCRTTRQPAAGCGSAPYLRHRRGLAQSRRRRRTQDRWIRQGRYRLGARASRGGSRLRRCRRGSAHWRACRVRGFLRPGQPSPHQWSVRRPALPGPGAGHRLAHPQRPDWRELLPGDPPGSPLPGVLELLRAHLHRRPGTACRQQRHPARHGQQVRLGGHPAR